MIDENVYDQLEMAINALCGAIYGAYAQASTMDINTLTQYLGQLRVVKKIIEDAEKAVNKASDEATVIFAGWMGDPIKNPSQGTTVRTEHGSFTIGAKTFNHIVDPERFYAFCLHKFGDQAGRAKYIEFVAHPKALNEFVDAELEQGGNNPDGTEYHLAPKVTIRGIN